MPSGLLFFLTLLLFVALGVGISALCGWLLMIVLAAFGVKAPFWACWVGWMLLSALFGSRIERH